MPYGQFYPTTYIGGASGWPSGNSSHTSHNEVPGSNPAKGGNQLISVRSFIAHSLSLSLFHRLEMTEIMLKGTYIPNSSSLRRYSYCFRVSGFSLMSSILQKLLGLMGTVLILIRFLVWRRLIYICSVCLCPARSASNCRSRVCKCANPI